MKKKRALLISCSVIMICVCIIAGMSYALFTDSVSVKNHLKAGNLDVTLKRTNLEYSVLDSEGVLGVTTVTEDLDLTESSSNNVFGIDSTDIYIVPGSYFDADLEINNEGNTAFTYSISIKMIGEANDLADQLKVTVTRPDGSSTTKMLSELAGGMSVETGRMTAGEAAQKFSVRVEFIDDVEYNGSLSPEASASDRMNNNDAQAKTAVFDLVVTAVQATSIDS